MWCLASLIEQQGIVECIMLCGALWPNSDRQSDTLTHPTQSEAPESPNLFLLGFKFKTSTQLGPSRPTTAGT